MNPFEAARVLYRGGETQESAALLDALWNAPDRAPQGEMSLFCAMLEVWATTNASASANFLEGVISGEGDLHSFWSRRSMAEQASLLEWHGQFCYAQADRNAAYSSLTRAASLGRDTSLLWRLLADIHAEHEELDLALRYFRRSLQLHRQLELDLLSGREHPMGFFTGRHPLGIGHGVEEYLDLLLRVTRVARGQKNLKAVRELLLELLAQHPDNEKLPQIRLLLEKAIVRAALVPPVTEKRPPAVASRIENPRGLAALFRA